MKVSIDEQACIGCGACEAACGACFKIEGNVAKVLQSECKDCDVRKVAEECPTGAIKVEE